MKKKAIVVLSGGMDSALCLAIALTEFKKSEILALTFNYGQRHHQELEQSKKLTSFFGVDQKIIDINFLNQITNNALVIHDQKIALDNNQIPNTMVLGRNGLMARIAGIQAASVEAHAIYLGVMELESANSGYRDCSREYMDLVEAALRLDFNEPQFEIRTPLIKMNKYDSMELGNKLGVLGFLLEETLTCYEGVLKEGCGQCPSCKLRNDGILKFIQKHPDFNFSYKDKIICKP